MAHVSHRGSGGNLVYDKVSTDQDDELGLRYHKA